MTRGPAASEKPTGEAGSNQSHIQFWNVPGSYHLYLSKLARLAEATLLRHLS